MKKALIRNLYRDSVQTIHIGYCDDFWSRLMGFMFRGTVRRDEGLLLVLDQENRIDSTIHMFFVFMDLAVIWIDSNFSVVDSVLAKSWRPLYIPKAPARYVLEIHPALLDQFQTGDEIDIAYV